MGEEPFSRLSSYFRPPHPWGPEAIMNSPEKKELMAGIKLDICRRQLTESLTALENDDASTTSGLHENIRRECTDNKQGDERFRTPESEAWFRLLGDIMAWQLGDLPRTDENRAWLIGRVKAALANMPP